MIETTRLRLELESLAAAQQRVAEMPSEHRAMLSADWLARFAAATDGDHWVLGFNMLRIADEAIVGGCGFKGPPSHEGVVEIAYYVEPAEQGQGYATEAAAALTRYAFQQPGVKLVCAHTLPQPNASTRVLEKCGFRHVGSVEDPEDGLVWRFEHCTVKRA